MACTASPRNRNSPDQEWSSIPRIDRSVDLPAPDGPMTVTNSPSSITSSMRRRTKVSPARVLKDFSRFWTSIMGELLFASEGFDRIDAGGAQRGNEAGRERDQAQRENDRNEGRRVRGADAIEEAGQDAAQRDGGAKTDGHTQEGRPHALGDDHAQNVTGPRAESDPDADLAAAPAHGIRQDAVDADRGERQSERGERRQERDAEALLNEGIAQDLFHRLDVRHRLVGIDPMESRDGRAGNG